MAGRRANGEGWIKALPNGKYQVRFPIGRDPRSGSVRYKTSVCANHKEAIETMRRLSADHRGGKLVQNDRKTLGGFLEQWLEHTIKPNRATNTYRQYEWIVREHVNPTLGSRPIDKVHRKDIQALLAGKAKQEVSARSESTKDFSRPLLSQTTLRLIKAVLHAAYNDAIRDGLAAHNPAELVAVPRAAARAEMVRWLTPEQAVKLARACEGRELGELILFMLHTGTRLGEATGIQWEDVKLGENPVVTIRGQLQRVKGEGMKRKEGTKTNQVRTLPLTATATRILQDLSARQILEESRDPEGLVFLSILGTRLDPKHVRTRLAALCKEAGVPVVSPHKLRHTAATLLLKETGDLHAVMKTLGHSQVALTANLYGHADSETLRPVVSKLERLLTD